MDRKVNGCVKTSEGATKGTKVVEGKALDTILCGGALFITELLISNLRGVVSRSTEQWSAFLGFEHITND